MITKEEKAIYAEAWLYYLSGNFSIKQIAEILDFPNTTLLSYAARHGWNQLRSKIHKEAGKGLKASLAERIEKARIRHKNFMIDQIDETAEGIAAKVIGEVDPEGDGKRTVGVSEKIDLIDRQFKVVNNVLKLDDNKDHDPVRVGFEFLLALGSMPHPPNSEASTGILRSNNAYLEGHKTPEIEVESHLMEVKDGVAVEIPQEEQDIVEMLREEGYDAEYLSRAVPSAVEPDDMTPPPIKLSFQ